jgi:predicted MFS family arabinose efflux permease
MEERGTGRPAYPWVVLGLLTAFWGVVGLNRIGISFIFPIIVPEFHMAFWQAGLLISGTSLTWAISTWGSGWLSDHFGRRRVLLPGAALACVLTAAMGGAWNFASMFVIRDLIGFGDGVGWPNSQAVLAAVFPARLRALAGGVFTGGYTLFGSVLGPIIVITLAIALGWRPVFPIIGAVFALVVVALWFVLKEPPRSAASPPTLTWGSAFSLLRNRHVIVLMLIQVGALAWLQVGTGFNTLFLTDIRHIPLGATRPILTAMGVASLLGILLLPPLSDYAGRKLTVTLGGVLSGVALGLYIFGNFGIVTTTALLCVSAFCWGVMIPLGSATCVIELVGDHAWGTAMGTVNFAGAILGTFVLPTLAGVVADRFGLSTAMAIAAVAVAIGGLLMLAIPETAPLVLARRATRTARAAP